MAKPIRKNGGAPKTGRGTFKSPAMPATTSGDIARRAYDLYLARGGEHGHDLEDWLRAERELKGSTASATPYA